jgi:hypothetical protein
MLIDLRFKRCCGLIEDKKTLLTPGWRRRRVSTASIGGVTKAPLDYSMNINP